MNNLESAIVLIAKEQAENKSLQDTYKLTNLVNISLIKKFDELEFYCDGLVYDLHMAESVNNNSDELTKRLMSTSSAVEELTDDLCVANDTNAKLVNDSLSMAALQRKVADKNIEIKSLNVYKRKFEVASKDLKSTLDKLQVEKVKNSLSKPVKQPKVTKNYKDLQAENARLNDYIKQLVEYGNTAPQYAGGLKHSKQGVMDFLDSKAELMGVTDPKTGESREVMVQRMFVINQHNSVKTLTRIVGEEGVHTVKVPKGGTVTIDDEVKDHVTEYFNKLDDMNGKIKQQKAGNR